MKILLPLLLLLLSGCAAHRADIAQRAQGQLPGLDRQALFACMGKPERQERQGDRELLAFAGVEPERGCPLMKLGTAKPPSYRCEAVFVLEDGKVKAVSYRLPDTDRAEDASHCGFLVEKCVK